MHDDEGTTFTVRDALAFSLIFILIVHFCTFIFFLFFLSFFFFFFSSSCLASSFALDTPLSHVALYPKTSCLYY
jgi:hypothetical protein